MYIWNLTLYNFLKLYFNLGTRSVGQTMLRYKDTCKSVLKSGNILDRWQNLVSGRTLWRRTIVDVCRKLNEKRIASYQRRKEYRARKDLIGNWLDFRIFFYYILTSVFTRTGWQAYYYYYTFIYFDLINFPYKLYIMRKFP